MLGDNPKRAAIAGNGDVLYIKKIFKTLQGEGIYAGVPAIFIRLGGCNLTCDFCDTEFEDFTEEKTASIINTIKDLSKNPAGKTIVKLVVITGGEPLRQPIAPLCQNLIDSGYKVQIETNGTLFRELPKQTEIICSPKIINGRYSKIREDLLVNITAFKFLISKSKAGYDTIPEIGQSKYNIPIFIQPMDQLNKKLNDENVKLAIDLAINNGYRLSYQLHKILNIE